MKEVKGVVWKIGTEPRDPWEQERFQKDDNSFRCLTDVNNRNEGGKRATMLDNLDIFAGLGRHHFSKLGKVEAKWQNLGSE